MTNKTFDAIEARKMVCAVANIAVAKGLVDSDWPGKLKVKLRNGRGIPCGGKLGGYPYINIATGNGWHTTPDKVTAKAVKSWEQSRPCPRRTRALQRFKNADAGLATWEEYASINDDPEIGRLLGDPSDTRAPMAAILCHEIAHAIQYTAGKLTIDGIEYGPGDRVHGKRWQAIYRVLRNAYVASGAYKPAPKALSVSSKKTRARLELIGLPLFAAAA